MSVHWKIPLKSHPMSLPDHSCKVENRKRYTFSLIDHTLAQPAKQRRSGGHFWSNQSFWFLCAPTPSPPWLFAFVHIELCTLNMSAHSCTCARAWFLKLCPCCWISGTSGEQRGRNQRHGDWEHLSASCACVYTWPQPSHRLGRSLTLPFTLLPLPPTPPLPSYCRGNSSAPAQSYCSTSEHLAQSHTHTPPGTVGLDLATASSENWLDSKVIKVIKANWGYWGEKRDPVKCVAENWASDGRKNGDGMDFREKRLIHGGHMCHGSHMTDIAITAFFPINTNPLHHVANNRKNTWHSQGNLCPPFCPNEAVLKWQVFTLARTRGSLGLSDY